MWPKKFFPLKKFSRALRECNQDVNPILIMKTRTWADARREGGRMGNNKWNVNEKRVEIKSIKRILATFFRFFSLLFYFQPVQFKSRCRFVVATEQKHISLITIQYFRVIWLNCRVSLRQINIAVRCKGHWSYTTKSENNNDNIENVVKAFKEGKMQQRLNGCSTKFRRRWKVIGGRGIKTWMLELCKDLNYFRFEYKTNTFAGLGWNLPSDLSCKALLASLCVNQVLESRSRKRKKVH